MRFAHIVPFLVVVALASPLPGQKLPGLGRMVRVEGDVNAPVSDVWRVFTTSEGAEDFSPKRPISNLRSADLMKSSSIRMMNDLAQKDSRSSATRPRR